MPVPFEAILTILAAVDQAMQHLSDGSSASSLAEDLLVVRQDFDLGKDGLSQVDACQKSKALNALVPFDALIAFPRYINSSQAFAQLQHQRSYLYGGLDKALMKYCS
jgi:hypothetical protein